MLYKYYVKQLRILENQPTKLEIKLKKKAKSGSILSRTVQIGRHLRIWF